MDDTNDHKDPGTVVETLVEHEGRPVRIYLAQSEATVPIEPYGGSSLRSETVSLDSFDAVIEFASLEDGGLTLLGMLHLSESEWIRTGFGTHW